MYTHYQSTRLNMVGGNLIPLLGIALAVLFARPAPAQLELFPGSPSAVMDNGGSDLNPATNEITVMNWPVPNSGGLEFSGDVELSPGLVPLGGGLVGSAQVRVTNGSVSNPNPSPDGIGGIPTVFAEYMYPVLGGSPFFGNIEAHLDGFLDNLAASGTNSGQHVEVAVSASTFFPSTSVIAAWQIPSTVTAFPPAIPVNANTVGPTGDYSLGAGTLSVTLNHLELGAHDELILPTSISGTMTVAPEPSAGLVGLVGVMAVVTAGYRRRAKVRIVN